MIAHFAMPTRNPRAVAEVFGRILDGIVTPFPPVPGGWSVIARDGSGVGVECLPEASLHHPGEGAFDPEFVSQRPGDDPWSCQIRQDGPTPGPSGFHVAITTELSVDEILEIARENGWRAVHAERGGMFDLVELWVDNRFMIEVLAPEGTRRYLDIYNPQVIGRIFAGEGAPNH